MNRHHMGPDGRSMLATSRPGVVMGLLTTRRVLAAAVPQRRPRTAAAATPVRPANNGDAAWAAAVAGLLKPAPDPWAALMSNLTGTRP